MKPFSQRKKITSDTVFDFFFNFLIQDGFIQSRDAIIFMHLHGLDGDADESLRKTAVHYGISAERVRQISQGIENHIPALFKFDNRGLFETTDALLKNIEEAAPNTDGVISKSLREGSLIGPTDSASSVVRIAQVLGRKTVVRLDDWEDQIAIVHERMPKCHRLVLSQAKKIVSSSGAINPYTLADSIATKQVILTYEEAEAMIRPFGRVAYSTLDQATGRSINWYFFPDASNDLITKAKNRIGTVGSCSISRLSQAESVRSLFFREIPEEAVAGLLTEAGFVVRGDVATLAECTANRLSSVQARMVDILKGMGGKATQRQFLAECQKQGLNASTSKVYLFRSNLFECADGQCELAI